MSVVNCWYNITQLKITCLFIHFITECNDIRSTQQQQKIKPKLEMYNIHGNVNKSLRLFSPKFLKCFFFWKTKVKKCT
jgi:hypothetical protein